MLLIQRGCHTSYAELPVYDSIPHITLELPVYDSIPHITLEFYTQTGYLYIKILFVSEEAEYKEDTKPDNFA